MMGLYKCVENIQHNKKAERKYNKYPTAEFDILIVCNFFTIDFDSY